MLPRHIGIIMDGNGRWAAKRKLGRSRGHKEGVESLIRTLDYCYDVGIYAVSVYAFSTENWKRPKKEIDKIFDILRDYLRTTSHRLIEQDAKFVVMGDITPLPKDLKKTLSEVAEQTKDCKSHIFNMGLNYGGRAELVRAFKSMIRDGVTDPDEETLSSYLDTAKLSDPDLIIRTSGEQRLSNFMIYQAAYSELYFTDTLWPDFGEKDLQVALDWFSSRKRKFGDVADRENE